MTEAPMHRRTTRAAALLTALILLLLPVTASCGKEKAKEPIGLVVVYTGPDVTDTRHTFTNDDFSVLASYEDGSDEYVHDYTFEVTGLEAGYYILNFTYNGYETEAYVRCQVPIYPSDLNP